MSLKISPLKLRPCLTGVTDLTLKIFNDVAKLSYQFAYQVLTHLPRVPIHASANWESIGSDNGLSPIWHQAITWTSDGILLIGPSGTNFSGILIEIHTFSFKKMHLKMLSRKEWPFCLGLNVLNLGYKAIIRHSAAHKGKHVFFFSKFIWLSIISLLFLLIRHHLSNWSTRSFEIVWHFWGSTYWEALWCHMESWN